MLLARRAITCTVFLGLASQVLGRAYVRGNLDPYLVPARSLQADDVCYTASSVLFLVNTTVQVQASQQLDNSSTTASLQQALSEYLHVPDCNIWICYNTTTSCPASSSADPAAACEDSTYICRGVVEVPVEVYSAIEDSSCAPDDSTGVTSCLGSTIDITTYLAVQQGQCCLQCPDQPDCSTESSAASASAPEAAAEAAPQCSNFSVSVAVGDSLSGSSAEAQLAHAVDNGLLDQYLHAAGLLTANALAVGPTGQLIHFMCEACKPSNCHTATLLVSCDRPGPPCLPLHMPQAFHRTPAHDCNMHRLQCRPSYDLMCST